MKWGAFSVSLNVKDLQISKSFYLNLGFQVFGGDESQNWLIMKNGGCIIGLFQGMFKSRPKRMKRVQARQVSLWSIPTAILFSWISMYKTVRSPPDSFRCLH